MTTTAPPLDTENEPRTPAIVGGLLASAWLASTVAFRTSASTGAIGGGFIAAIALTGLAAITWAAGGRSDLLRPRLATPQRRALLVAAAALVLAYVVPTVAAGAPRDALFACVRLAVVAAFGALVVLADVSDAPARPFAWAGVTFIAVHLALLGAGIAVHSLRPLLFHTLPHEHLGLLPRFSGLTGIPASTGTWALLAVGLAEGVPSTRIRRATRIGGLVVVLTTLSLATLALPMVVASAVLRGGRVRTVVVAALGLSAAAAIHVHVLSVEAGGHSVTLSTLPAGYELHGLGPALTPVHDARALGVGARFHLTGYGALAGHALACFAAHPIAGVGPTRFKDVCTGPTMNTYGTWSSNRVAHNQFLGGAAETGVVGIALTLLAVGCIAKSFAWSWPSPWSAAAATGLVVCGFGGYVVLTLPGVGFLALFLRARRGTARAVSVSA